MSDCGNGIHFMAVPRSYEPDRNGSQADHMFKALPEEFDRTGRRLLRKAQTRKIEPEGAPAPIQRPSPGKFVFSNEN